MKYQELVNVYEALGATTKRLENRYFSGFSKNS